MSAVRSVKSIERKKYIDIMKDPRNLYAGILYDSHRCNQGSSIIEIQTDGLVRPSDFETPPGLFNI